MENPLHAVLYSAKLTIKSEDGFCTSGVLFMLINVKVMAIVLLTFIESHYKNFTMPCIEKKKKLSLFI